MLKEKEATCEGIKTVKLSTGEEIIADVLELTASTMRVKRPLSLVLAEMPGSPQQTQVVFTPWMLALDENGVVDIERAHIISFAPAKRDASDQYVAATRP